jgi:hypothetical protein
MTIIEQAKLTFSGPMSYYADRVFEFNIPAGHSCPNARECLVKADRETGKMVNGRDQQFRCYAAQSERFPSARKSRWRNFELLKSAKTEARIAALINRSLPTNASRIRIHGSGDFFNQRYLDAWIKVCEQNSNLLFWAFTKSVQYWVNRIDKIPENLIMQASRGGRQDHLIDEYALKSATVFKTIEEAKKSGMPIDVDDTYACTNQGSFALVDNFGPDKGGRP